jgi:hypothetical protein
MPRRIGIVRTCRGPGRTTDDEILAELGGDSPPIDVNMEADRRPVAASSPD